MTPIAIFTKTPAETQDYDIDFSAYLAALGDTAASHALSVEPGITLADDSLTAGVVKVWLSGGTDGRDYHATATLTSTGGRIHQATIRVRVRS